MDKIETLLFVSFNYFILNASLIFFIKIILYRDVYLLLLFLKLLEDIKEKNIY